MVGHAIVDETKKYRYRLSREWAKPLSGQGYSHPPTITWIMLNPSTADAEQDDPTIRRCITFSDRWGFSKLIVVNLFALRATNPKHLLTETNPVGQRNHAYIQAAINESDGVIAAWGAFGLAVPDDVRQVLEGVNLWCLGTTKEGHPRHPLYVKTITDRVRYEFIP